MTQASSIDLAIDGLLRGRGKNGRALYDGPAKRRLVQLCSRADVSIAKAALVNGVNANLLRKWIGQSRRGDRGTGAGTAVKKARALTMMPVVLTQSVSAPVVATAPQICEVVLARGTLRLASSQSTLATLIQLLSN
jgi:transposase-like protein